MPNLNYYSKLIGGVVGNAVAIFLGWLAMQFPSIASCTIGPEGTEACAILGFSQVQITSALMLVINALFVYHFPANQVTATQAETTPAGKASKKS